MEEPTIFHEYDLIYADLMKHINLSDPIWVQFTRKLTHNMRPLTEKEILQGKCRNAMEQYKEYYLYMIDHE